MWCEKVICDGMQKLKPAIMKQTFSQLTRICNHMYDNFYRNLNQPKVEPLQELFYFRIDTYEFKIERKKIRLKD